MYISTLVLIANLKNRVLPIPISTSSQCGDFSSKLEQVQIILKRTSSFGIPSKTKVILKDIHNYCKRIGSLEKRLFQETR